jgi:hypothetical protein
MTKEVKLFLKIACDKVPVALSSGPMIVADLAEAMGEDPSATSALVDCGVAHGFLDLEKVGTWWLDRVLRLS